MANVVFELFAKLGLDSSEYENGLGEAKTEANSVMDAIGKGFKTAAGIGAAAIGAATTAVGAFGMESIKSYANYEQLVGGIDTLFGTSSKKLQGYADEAYKTAGLSANEYMNTAIGFSGALLKSLGGDTAKAAETTNMAIKDMADQANKYGKTVDSISETYTSLARGNTQMLDNLFGGMFAGTKAGLKEMLEYAENYRASMGETVSYSADSYADIVSAIHDVSMATGVYGTTTNEAMTTIEGSLNATKSAWQNVITAIAGGGDISAAMDGLITSIFGELEGEGLLNQITPRIEQTMEGIGDFIAAAAPFITEKIPELIAAILPSMVSAGLGLLSTVGQTIINTVPALMGSIFSEIDSAISNSSFGSAWDGIKSSITTAIEGIKGSFDTLVTALSPITEAVGGVVEKFQEWIDSGDALNEATELFSTGIELVGEGISLFLEGLASVIDYGVQFTEWLTSGSDGADAFMAVLTGIATIIGLVTANMAAHAIAAGAYQVAMMAVQGVTNLVAGAQAALNAVMAANPIGIVVVAIAALVAALVYLYNNNETVRAAIDAAWQGIKTAVEVAIEGIKAALYAIGEFIVTTWETVTSAVETAMTTISTVVSTAWNAVGTLISTTLTTISTTITTIWSTITSTISTKMDNIKTKITTVWTNIKTSITSAITLIKSTVTNGFTTMVSNLTTPLTNMKTAITGAFNSVKDTISGVIDSALTWGSDLIDNFVSGIKNNISKVGDAIGGVADKIKSLIGFSEPEDGPLSRFHTFAPDMMELFAQGIDQSAYLVTDALKRNFDFYDDIVRPLNMDSSASSGLVSSRSGDFNETINIYAPTALDPSEVARQTRKANREMMLALRGI